MCVEVPVWVYSQTGDRVGVCVSTHVPLFSVRPLGHVQTGPLGLSKHSHSHFFLSHGLATDKHTQTHIKLLQAQVFCSSLHVLQWAVCICFPLTLRLLVAMVQNYICGMIQSNCQVLNRTFAKFVHSKHVVVNVGDAIDIVFKYINSKGVMEICIETKQACYRKFTRLCEESEFWPKSNR